MQVDILAMGEIPRRPRPLDLNLSRFGHHCMLVADWIKRYSLDPHTMTNDEFLKSIGRPCIDFLEEAVVDMQFLIPKPKDIREPDYPRYRYVSVTPEIFCVCRAVRIVSSLDAQ